MLETARLRLRAPSAADAERLWAIWSDPLVQEGLLTRPQTRDAFAPILQILLSTPTMWVLEDRTTRDVIGRAGYFEFSAEQTAEIAYLLHPGWWGRGLATETAEAVLRHAFEGRGWQRAIAFVRPANTKSIRVLQKLGFHRISSANIRGQNADLYERHREA